MQQYVLTLEAERNELQRGLDKQMALVRKLADEQGAADDTIEGAKRDVVRLQEELLQCRGDLATQVRARAFANHSLHVALATAALATAMLATASCQALSATLAVTCRRTIIANGAVR